MGRKRDSSTVHDVGELNLFVAGKHDFSAPYVPPEDVDNAVGYGERYLVDRPKSIPFEVHPGEEASMEAMIIVKAFDSASVEIVDEGATIALDILAEEIGSGNMEERAPR